MNWYRTIVTAPEKLTQLRQRNSNRLLPDNRTKTEQETLAAMDPSTELKPNSKKPDDDLSHSNLILFPFENLLSYKLFDPRTPGFKTPLPPMTQVVSDLYFRIVKCFNAFSRACVKEGGLKVSFVSVRFLEKVGKSSGIVLDGKLDVWFAFKRIPYGGWITAAYVGDHPIDLENLLIKL